jgi:hypothetical protein
LRKENEKKKKMRRSLRAKEKAQNIPLSSCATSPLFFEGAYLYMERLFFELGDLSWLYHACCAQMRPSGSQANVSFLIQEKH